MKEPVQRAERQEEARARVQIRRALRLLDANATDAAHVESSPSALLRASLEVAVPLWIEQLRSLTGAERRARAHVCADVIAHKGDVILYKSDKKGETAEAFNRLSEGIACLAFSPGGVKVFGLHFNARIPV